MRLLHLGHASFLLTLADGTAILLDPWFGGYPLFRRRPPVRRPEELGRVDLVLVSHNHLDHVDRAALRLARGRGAALVGPPAVAARARRAGVAPVHALVPGDEVTVRGVRVRGVPAEHPLCRGPIGFFLDADGTTVYFSGDTRPVVPLVEELRRLRPRVALVQISCAVYLGTPDGLTESAAADLVRAVSPGVAVPMHYEARRKTPADPASFRRRLEGSGVRVVVPDRGREVEL